MCLRRDSDCVYSQTRFQASSRDGKRNSSVVISDTYWSTAEEDSKGQLENTSVRLPARFSRAIHGNSVSSQEFCCAWTGTPVQIAKADVHIAEKKFGNFIDCCDRSTMRTLWYHFAGTGSFH